MTQPTASTSDNNLTDAVDLLLKESGVSSLNLDGTYDAMAARRHRIGELLADIASFKPEDEEEGGTSAVVRGTAINVTGSVWSLCKCTAKLAVAGIAAHDPTGILAGITWTVAAEQVIETLEDLRTSVHRLDLSERLICAAIADKSCNNWKDGQKLRGATFPDIADYFQKAEPPQPVPVNADKIIEKLVADRILSIRNHPQYGPLYRITI